MKQAIKKGAGIKKKGISAWKEKVGLNATAANLAVSNADKPMDWLVMPKAFQEATRLTGFPIGYISMIGGFSDTGKTTILNHVLVSAQRQGFIPVIYDTENNMDWKYLTDMGFEATPVYAERDVEHVDPETGEVTYTKENQIITYDGDFIYFNNNILAAKYGQYDYSTGKETKNKRKDAVIEDIAASMKELLDAQDNGEIDQGFVFVWDSIGSINSYKSYKSVTNNNMFDAGSVSVAFSNILNNRIPSSRKMSSSYTNTMVAISKIWLDSMTAPMAAPTVKYKNGNTFFYACHGLIVHVGGALTSGTKKLKAVSKGATYRYGLETKIKVVKNHLPSPYNVTYEGNMICTAHGLIDKEELPQYQKEHIGDMLAQLNEQLSKSNKTADIEDVVFTDEEEE
jgi:hypothetical protein